MVAEAEAGFAAFTIKLRVINFKVGVGGSAVANSLGFATESAEGGVMGIVTI